jgi:hypothetical protein
MMLSVHMDKAKVNRFVVKSFLGNEIFHFTRVLDNKK